MEHDDPCLECQHHVQTHSTLGECLALFCTCPGLRL